ncbi:alpha/beta hydrolase [Pseudoxanthomonas sp. JBR18]|uniref:alpha/beta hydrolase n=1 Tax=Pseudoxanthomonas sp. JBR18 TaxID=2969308 RepID=UPI00230601B2|nr:alpha/beta hydrolase [Pseudoxanthomonas sp. JBR18]WCE05697.1 alpha/beta hydrolase [Pseudoxanthomonas sp. JBR18]
MNKRFPVRRTLVALLLALAASGTQAAIAAPINNIVLVHGYFADGSGWKAVADLLTHDGYKVSIVQEPETSFQDDVKATTRVVDMQDGPSILVGHSYGGAVVTQAGNNAKVAGLVYINAFQPDAGESLKTLVEQMPGATKAIKPTQDGFLYLDPADFHADFAADIPAREAKFMAISQVMPSVETFGAPVTTAAWKTKPSWALVSMSDRTVNPALERFMAKRAGSTTVEIDSSHVAFLSHPADVAKLIEQAAGHLTK